MHAGGESHVAEIVQKDGEQDRLELDPEGEDEKERVKCDQVKGGHEEHVSPSDLGLEAVHISVDEVDETGEQADRLLVALNRVVVLVHLLRSER